MRYITIITFLLLLSCNRANRVNNQIADYNDKIINYELQQVDDLYLISPRRTETTYIQVREIQKTYLRIRENLISNKLDTASISNYLNYLFLYMKYPFYAESIMRALSNCDPSTILFQIQNITIYAIKNLREQIYINDYPTNYCQVVAVKENDKFVRLVVSKIDTTSNPKFFVGKLKVDENKFLNSFDSVESRLYGYGRIPINKLDNKNYIEGLLILPRNNCTLDTIRFESNIK